MRVLRVFLVVVHIVVFIPRILFRGLRMLLEWMIESFPFVPLSVISVSKPLLFSFELLSVLLKRITTGRGTLRRSLNSLLDEIYV